jgi:hypothetical protein
MGAKQEARKIAQEIRWRQQREKVIECQCSGQTIHAWCKGHGIAPSTYYRWLERVRIEELQAMVEKNVLSLQTENQKSIPAQPLFTELPALPAAVAEEPSAPEPAAGEPAIRVQIGGAVVEIQKEADARLAESVVRALAGQC